jgi:hypothetical protein
MAQYRITMYYSYVSRQKQEIHNTFLRLNKKNYQVTFPYR